MPPTLTPRLATNRARCCQRKLIPLATLLSCFATNRQDGRRTLGFAEAVMTLPRNVFDYNIPFCVLPFVLPFGNEVCKNDSDGPFRSSRGPCAERRSENGTRESGRLTSEKFGKTTFSMLAAGLMALDHLYNNDPSVVKELSSANMTQCLLPFGKDSVRVMSSDRITRHDYDRVLSFQDDPRGSLEECEVMSVPCATVGILGDENHEVLKLMSSALKLPAMLVDWKLPSVSKYGNIVVNDLPSKAFSMALLDYLQRPGLERSYVTILRDGSQYSATMAQSMQSNALEKYRSEVTIRDVVVAPVVGGGNSQLRSYVENAMKDILKGGHRTIFVMLETVKSQLPIIAEVAQEIGLLSSDVLWILDDRTVPHSEYRSTIQTTIIETTRTSFTAGVNGHEGTDEVARTSLSRLLLGSAVVRVLDGFAVDPQNDRFLRQWRAQDANFVRRVQEKLAVFQNHKPYYDAPDDFFQVEFPTQYSGFFYDAVIALAMAACAVFGNFVNRFPTVGADDVIDILIEAISALGPAIRDTKFSGASGEFQFDRQSSFRHVGGVSIGLFNGRRRHQQPARGDNVLESDVIFVLTSIFNGHGWRDVEGEGFIYHDGTTIAPIPLRKEQQKNFISPRARFVGFGLMAIGVFVSVASAICVVVMRRDPTFQVAQPQFLVLVCLGCAVCVLCIFPLSQDDRGHELSDSLAHLDMACMASLWLFVMGYCVAYLAVFCKLWRINRVMQFVRRKVRVYHVIWPLVCVVLVAILILTLWTVLDPRVWTRTVTKEFPLESHGQCECEHTVAFATSLVFVLMLATILAALMAWRTLDIADEYSESIWILRAMVAQIQIWIITVPLLLAFQSMSADATFIGISLVVWTFSTSMVVLIVGPRIFRCIADRVFAQSLSSTSAGNDRTSSRVRISGFTPTNGNNISMRDSGCNESQRSHTLSTGLVSSIRDRSQYSERTMPDDDLGDSRRDETMKPTRLSSSMHDDNSIQPTPCIWEGSKGDLVREWKSSCWQLLRLREELASLEARKTTSLNFETTRT